MSDGDRERWGDRWNTSFDYEKQGDVIFALRDGDTQPLIRLLRSGEIPTRSLSLELADMLEGTHPYFNLDPIGKKGRKGFSEHLEIEARRRLIGIVAEQYVRRAGKGGYEAALSELEARFPEHSLSYIKECRAKCRAILSGASEEYREAIWQSWVEVWGDPI